MIQIFGNCPDTSHAKPTTGRKNSSRRAEPPGERATEKPEKERESEEGEKIGKAELKARQMEKSYKTVDFAS